MFKTLLVALFLLVPTLALAQLPELKTDKCEIDINKLDEFNTSIGGHIVALNEIEKAKLFGVMDKPDALEEPFSLKVMVKGNEGMIIIVKDDCVIHHSPKINVEKFIDFLHGKRV